MKLEESPEPVPQGVIPGDKQAEEDLWQRYKAGRRADHQRWPNRYFKKLGLFCLLDARETEFASLRNGANP